jgi:hypothetical protein
MHLENLHRKFGVDGRLDPSLPLFPNFAGGFCTKESVVETFEFLAEKSGEELKDALGRRAFGGHSARVSGARYLASIGLELFKLMVLARWAGPTILRYVSEAPLAHITADVKRLIAGDELHDVLKLVNTQSIEMDQKLVRLAQAETELAKQVEEMLASGAAPGYVSNHKSGAWHRVLIGDLGYLPCRWKTSCGWKFGDCAVTRSKRLPGAAPWYLLCDRCLVSERAVAKAAQGAANAPNDPRDYD